MTKNRINKLTIKYKERFPELGDQQIAQLIKGTITGRAWGVRRDLKIPMKEKENENNNPT